MRKQRYFLFISIATLTRLIDAGVSLSTVDTPEAGNTALHWATSFGSSKEVVNLFIVNGADVNARNANGAVPLHEAVKQKNESIMNMLLRAGGDMSIVAEKGKFEGKSPQTLANELKLTIFIAALLFRRPQPVPCQTKIRKL